MSETSKTNIPPWSTVLAAIGIFVATISAIFSISAEEAARRSALAAESSATTSLESLEIAKRVSNIHVEPAIKVEVSHGVLHLWNAGPVDAVAISVSRAQVVVAERSRGTVSDSQNEWRIERLARNAKTEVRVGDMDYGILENAPPHGRALVYSLTYFREGDSTFYHGVHVLYFYDDHWVPLKIVAQNPEYKEILEATTPESLGKSKTLKLPYLMYQDLAPVQALEKRE